MATTVLRLLIALIISSNVLADGIDDPSFYDEPLPPASPNYYRDYDKNPCRYPLGPPGVPCQDANRIEYIPSILCEPVQRIPATVPEPNPELLLLMGLTALFIKMRLKK